jgi:predicted HAD superfamily phosphohydrolase YqeG
MKVISSILDIDFDRVREAGIECVAFDWDLTLAGPDGKLGDAGKVTLEAAAKAFAGNVSIISNKTKRPEAAGVETIPHKWPKPFCAKPVLDFFGKEPVKVLIVGDRLLTDALLAWLGGFCCVYIRHKDASSYPLIQKPIVWLEHAFLDIIE